MHKPPRRMHTSTRRFPLSRRSPSKRRAFLGVFSITKSFGRHDKCQRPRISLQIKRCQPITPPIIRRKHREIPIFRPRPVCRGLRLQNTRKNARRHHPHMARTKTKARPIGRAPSLFRLIIARCGNAEPAGRRASSLPAHSALIFSVLKTSMMHPYTIDVDTIRCGPRGDPTFRWRPQGCPRFLTCPARAAASRDRRMT